MSKGWMYILECSDGSYYTGSTKDLELRFKQHQNGEGANHTKKRLPVKLVYCEEFSRIDNAYYREKQVQGWSRKKKEALINDNHNKLPELAKAYRDVASRTSATDTRTSATDTRTSATDTRTTVTKVNTMLPEALEGNNPETKVNEASTPLSLLIPKLRFPEFQNDAEWEEKELSIALDVKSSQIAKNKLSFIKKGYPVFGADGMLGYIDSYIQEDDYIAIIKDGSGVGNLFFHKGQSSLLGTLNYLFSKDDKKYILKWLYYLLQIISFKPFIKGSGIPHIYYKDYSKLLILIPKDPKEQQKIANCLSSLDDLITAQTEKLALLKEHKKGLLQQLFPAYDNQGAERSRRPQLRFPEFQNDGEWEVKRLSKLGKLINGLTYSPKDVCKEGLLVLRSSNVQNGQILLDDCVFVRPNVKGANIAKPNDILVCVRNGSKRLIGKNAIIPKGISLATHGAFMTMFRANNPSFVFQLFQTKSYSSQVKADLGATINSINGKNFTKYEFAIPKNPKEQQKIANCLSSLDKVITGQSEKLALLKDHKKGLMQQLFPNVNDVAT